MRRRALLAAALVLSGCAHVMRGGAPGWGMREMTARHEQAGMTIGLRALSYHETSRYIEGWARERGIAPLYITVRNTTTEDWLIDAGELARTSEEILREARAESGTSGMRARGGTLTLVPGLPVVTLSGVAAVSQAPLDQVYASYEMTRVSPGREVRGLVYLRSLSIYDPLTITAVCPATGTRLEFRFTGADILRGKQIVGGYGAGPHEDVVVSKIAACGVRLRRTRVAPTEGNALRVGASLAPPHHGQVGLSDVRGAQNAAPEPLCGWGTLVVRRPQRPAPAHTRGPLSMLHDVPRSFLPADLLSIGAMAGRVGRAVVGVSKACRRASGHGVDSADRRGETSEPETRAALATLGRATASLRIPTTERTTNSHNSAEPAC